MCACQHTFKSQSCWLTLNPHFFLLKENACCYFLIMFTVQIPMAVAKKSRYNISQLNCAQHINIYNYIYIYYYTKLYIYSIHPHPSQIFISPHLGPGPSAWLCWFFFAASCAPAAAICAADCGERPSALAAQPMARAACFTWRYQVEPIKMGWFKLTKNGIQHST